MKNNILFLFALALLVGVADLRAQGTAFTYQGRLNDGVNLATGIYDLRFTVYAAAHGGGSVVGEPVDASDVGITNGLFTVVLDFGGAPFDGAVRWLEIGVRPGASSGDFDTLAPRQQITATPYAMRAANFSGPVAASQITGTLAATNIGIGTITSSNLAAGAALANLASNSITAIQLAGGAAAANLNASSQSGVPSGGLVLSAKENTALLNAGYIRIGTTVTPDAWQQRVNGTPPSARAGHAAVWTGSEMIIWGGENGGNTGGCYNPAGNSWTAVTTSARPPRASVTRQCGPAAR